MTEHEEREVKLMALNVSAQLTSEQVVALCAELLDLERDKLRAWLARREAGQG